ncbi:hypothetical protein BCV69DRAFT_158721 [Microstroma glucosiphilum]|uniref:Uncharacterized protein n=1 Tax=Pseudomicrostroma glucosiphilum TaxID=1684307 RepID=A0A316U9Q6_9BASI|nr:hypothetical protein BCV69DRAFT_158721 [Pseudomicrostroma glucosiphilum]PWN21889.1 hypothetical protein BCV69DRAFT_158721 [Pseudomicrostroma glucosiphilum]
MDRLTPRDLAVARFRRNHDFIEAIFDEKKIANLEPPPSPYADLSRKDLQAQLDLSEAQTAEMKRLHEERIQSFKQNISAEQIEKDVARQAEVNPEEEAALEPWARNAGKGRRLTAGFAYVQARTPEVVKGALRARETALAEQRAELSAGQETAEARQQKAAEDEAIRKLNLEHGMEPPAPVSMPPPPQQPRPPQQQQPVPPQQLQQPEPQEVQQLQPTDKAPTDVAGEAVDADAEADADADPDADADADADGEGEGDGDGDQEMVELVDNGEGGAAGLAAVPEAAADGQAQQTQEEEVADAATANEEAENLTHPLSAEAEAAASAPEDAGTTMPTEATQELPVVSEAAPEAAAEAVPEAATEAPLESVVPAEPETATETAPAAATEATGDAETATKVVPEPSEASAGVPPVAEEVSQQQPSEEIMKAPTPPLDENLAENDAPKQL